MAKKKATSKKTKASKARTRKTTRSAPAGAGAGAEADAENGGDAGAKPPKTRKRTAKKATKRKTASRKRARRSDTPESESAASAPAGPHVERGDDGVIIRFPSELDDEDTAAPTDAEPEAAPAVVEDVDDPDDAPAPPQVEAVEHDPPADEPPARTDPGPTPAEEPTESDVPTDDDSAADASGARDSESAEPPQGEGGRRRRRRGGRRRRRGRSGDAEQQQEGADAAEHASRSATTDAEAGQDAVPGDHAPSRSERSGEDEGREERRGRRRRGGRRRKRRGEGAQAARDEEGGGEAEAGEAGPVDRESDDTDDDEDTEDIIERVEERTEPQPRRGRRRRRGRRGRDREEAAPEPAAAPEDDDTEDAERPSGVKREMIINVVPREECRIATLENGKLEEIYLERASSENHVGNIYKGLVTNVEPSIQAAFIDFGLGKNGFLHISDLHPQHFPEGERQTENVGRKMPRRNRPPIQRCLRRGQELLVQVTKEGIGTKGPTLTTYLSIPGRFLVMMPGMRQLGVSRKIEDDDLRRKLRDQLTELELPDDIGFIARTAAEGRTKRELQSDLNYLTRLWRAVEKRIKEDAAPAELYRDSDLVIRTIRDVYTHDIERIVVDDEEMAERAREFLSIFNPRARDIVNVWDSPVPVFHHYGIEAELERLHSRHVPLKIGGSLVIDQAEALVAIDVNSGRFRTEDDAETTAYKINCEAADEIPRQLRLRDLGGVVICDFIDMRLEKHRRAIYRQLVRNLKEHKERAKVLPMSRFGMIELTRQRQRASLTRSVYQDCSHCRGTGLVKTSESVALDVMRLIQLACTREHIRSIEVSVSPEVAYLLQNRKRALIYGLERQNGRNISIRPEPSFGLDQSAIQCFDHRGRLVPHP